MDNQCTMEIGNRINKGYILDDTALIEEINSTLFHLTTKFHVNKYKVIKKPGNYPTIKLEIQLGLGMKS